MYRQQADPRDNNVFELEARWLEEEERGGEGSLNISQLLMSHHN